MKKLAFILILVLPVLLLSQTMLHNSITAPHQPDFKQHPQLTNQRSMYKPYLPGNNALRDRSWRLKKIVWEVDWDAGRPLEIVSIDSLFYGDSTPAAVDSLRAYYWSTLISEWQLNYVKKYAYDATGEYVTEVGNYYTPGASLPSSKTLYNYNSQHRLISYIIYEYDTDINDYIMFYRVNHLYGVNQINQTITFINDPNNATYYKYIYTHDAQGRIIATNASYSADSLNWSNASLEEFTYHANDTTTAQDYIDYLAHYTPINSQWGSMIFGMPAVSTSYSGWNGNDWDYVHRNVYFYNALNQLTEINFEYFNTIWQPTNRSMYTYDANSNLDQILYQNWETLQSDWGNPIQRSTYIWDQTTANNDDTITPVAMSLSVYPNPFNSSVNISFASKSNAPVKTSIYNLKGQLVKSFDNYSKSIVWDGKDTANQPVSNGIYLIKSAQDGKSVCRKAVKITN
ncbi:MAG: T9SS type A sorting domain-containing protein [Candidatus Cloacimonadaceae bacterium]